MPTSREWICVGLLATGLSLCVVAVAAEPTPIVVEAKNSSSDNGEATETQQATCHIVTETLAATASATVTHALKGVCTTKELEKHFLNLTSEISSQMMTIKSMLFQIKQLLNDLQEDSMDYAGEGIPQESKINEAWNKTRGARDTEINKDNYTIHTDKRGNQIFSYFWKIDCVRSIIYEQNHSTALRSPSFYVNRGYRMYIKMFPQQNGGNIYIHVGLTRGEFDERLPWPFRLKHQVMVLDQSGGSATAEDLASRVWDPAVLCTPGDWQQPGKYKDNDECVGFGFSQETIFTRNYLLNDSILIKLDVQCM